MQKTLIIFIFISILFSCQKQNFEEKNPVKAIPIDASLIIETNNLSNSLHELSNNKLWKLLSTKTCVKKSKETILNIDSSLATYASNLSSSNPLFLSLHSTGAKSFDWLALNSTHNEEQKFALLEIALKKITETIQHPYSNTIINELILKSKNIFYAKYKGILMISPTKILIEDAIRQLKTPNNLLSNSAFNNIFFSSNKKEDFNLYINSKKFDKISKSILNSTSSSVEFADWFQWDIDLHHNNILLSGMCISHDSLAQELSFFDENNGHPPISPSVLPKNTVLFASKCFENYKQYERKKIIALEKSQQKMNSKKKVVPIKDALKNEFKKWINSEITWFLTENANELHAGLIIDLANSQIVEDHLKQEIDSITEYRQESIFKWEQLKYIPDLLQTKKEDYQYCCILQDQLIIMENIAQIKILINDFKMNKSLNNTIKFQRCMEELNTQSNLIVYINKPTSLNLTQHFLGINLTTFFDRYAEELEPLQSIALEFSTHESICYSNAYVYFDDSQKEELKNIWTKQIDARITSTLNLVQNHYTQEWEITFQDENNNLYLISSEGDVIWKRKLDNQIIGSIHQIDSYKNFKLQLLFNTKNKVFLIDRKGRDVGSFPISLKQETTLPLSLFDYEKNKNYRIMLSCDKNHYMYDKNGEYISGWKLKKTKSNAILPAQHFVVGNKDYILLAEENGTLNILNRRGENRIRVKEKIQFSQNKLNVIKGETLAESRIVTIDKNGIQQNILFDGSTDNALQFNFNDQVQYNYIENHHTFLEGPSLKVNGPNINMQHTFENNALKNIRIHNVKNEYFTSITDSKLSQTYLFRESNDLEDGFPIYGNTNSLLKDIDQDGKLNFIVGDASGIIYNYAID